MERVFAFAVFVVITSLASPVFAQPSKRPARSESVRAERSEWFYLPAAGSAALSAKYSYIPEASSELMSKSTGLKLTDVTASGQIFSTSLDYGIASDLKVGARVSYLNTKSEGTVFGTPTTYTSSGLGDLEFNGLGAFQLPVGRLYAGGRVTLSPERHKEATSSKEGNKMSGGWSLEPDIGYAVAVVPGLTIGAEASYQLMGERTSTDQETPVETESTVKNGNTLKFSGFAEFLVHPSLLLSVGAGINSIQAQDTTTNNTTATEDAHSEFLYGAGLHVYLSPLATLMLSYQGTMISEHGLSSTLRTGGVTLSAYQASLRFEF